MKKLILISAALVITLLSLGQPTGVSKAWTFPGNISTIGNIISISDVILTRTAEKELTVSDTIVAAKGKFTDVEITNTVDISTVAVMKADSGVYDGGYITPTAFDNGQALDIKLADSTGYLQGSYATGKALRDYTNNIYPLTLFGCTIKAMTVGLSIADATASRTLTESSCHFIAVYLPTAQTITGVKVMMIVQGAYAPADYNGVGLYSESGGTLTLVASSTNDEADPNIWEAGGYSIITKAFSSTYNASPGLYYVALLHNESDAGGETAPTIAANSSPVSAMLGSLGATNSKTAVCMTLAAQTALPSPTVLTSALTGSSSMPLVFLY